MSAYCWRFGEHKGDPCQCGWSSKTDKDIEIKELRDKVIEQGRHADFLQNKLNSAEKQLCEIVQFLGRDASAEGVSSIAEVVRQDVERLREIIEKLLELGDDLRCYTHAWDYKYGEYWDKELDEAREALIAEGD